MFVKIINFSRKEPRVRRDLSRLLKYLLLPKEDSSEKPSKPRLLGPPELFHLATTKKPWGSSAEEAADDLSYQMLQYAREACQGKKFPHTWYVHIVLSFHPRDSSKLESPQDRLKHRNPYLSRTKNAMRISIDMLKTLGISFTQPIALVAHADRRHIHVHAVVILPLKGVIEWDAGDDAIQPWHQGLGPEKNLTSHLTSDPRHYLLNYSRLALYEWSLINTKVFELTPPSKRALNRNKQVKQLWEDLQAL